MCWIEGLLQLLGLFTFKEFLIVASPKLRDLQYSFAASISNDAEMNEVVKHVVGVVGCLIILALLNFVKDVVEQTSKRHAARVAKQIAPTAEGKAANEVETKPEMVRVGNAIAVLFFGGIQVTGVAFSVIHAGGLIVIRKSTPVVSGVLMLPVAEDDDDI